MNSAQLVLDAITYTEMHFVRTMSCTVQYKSTHCKENKSHNFRRYILLIQEVEFFL